jgi:hypothetical protein
MLEVGNIRRFAKAGNFASFCRWLASLITVIRIVYEIRGGRRERILSANNPIWIQSGGFGIQRRRQRGSS